MKNYEKRDAARVAPVIRAARKLKGKTQREVAGLLGITQANLSLVESGKATLSHAEFFRICEVLSLNPEDAFYSGYIDTCLPVESKSLYPESRFKVPKKYLHHQGSKVRTIRTHLRYFAHRMGEAKLHEYFQHVKIDPDFFVVYDNQLNIRFSMDLLTCLAEKGFLKPSDIPTLTAPLTSQDIHGRLHREYQAFRSTKELIRRFISHIERYETNFKYGIQEETATSLVISHQPSLHMRYFGYRSEILGDFLCSFKKDYLRTFSTYSGMAPVTIQERECIFKGAPRCIYEVEGCQ